MSPIELRYAIYKSLVSLDRDERITDVFLVPPAVGEPVKLRVHTLGPWDESRNYTVTITEDSS